jgi:TetR/AcrR family transcriptional regulator, cholesterol catabolism regulator
MPRPSRWGEIVQAAAEEFREQGYDAATIEAIARRVGMLKGSLYNYIENKDDLLFAVIEEPAQQLLDDLERLTASDALPATARLHQLVRAQVRVFSEHYPAAFVYLQQIGRPSHREDFREMDERYITAIEDIIAAGVAQGEFAGMVRPAVAARAIVGMLDWMSHWFVPRSIDEDEAVADELFAMAVGGLTGTGAIWVALQAHAPEPSDA